MDKVADVEGLCMLLLLQEGPQPWSGAVPAVLQVIRFDGFEEIRITVQRCPDASDNRKHETGDVRDSPWPASIAHCS